ncbi:protein phosphatase CheZ [Roseospira marina]|nr:protein phosphatase CheZ [Roseospira marina]MBB4312199.1 chemotaxis protein CheZ [Roseospira marina]MBB5085785.1 chemotaxis protein CheZ [Roseospira marina]
MVFDVGAGAETGAITALLDEIKSLRGDIGDLRSELVDAVKAPPPPPAEPVPVAEAPPRAPHDPASYADAGNDWKREAELLRIEVARMVRSLASTKREIAEIKHPLRSADEDRMIKAANELDAIVDATEAATNDILDASETISNHAVDMLSEMGEADAFAPKLRDINEQVGRIMEACNFQDITGQRVNKVVKTLEFIEDRIRTIVEDWGREAFLDLPLPDEDVADDPADESKLLNGPQLANKGLSQDDIDALFG